MNFKKAVLLLIVSTVFLVLLFVSEYNHEKVHEAISINHGCQAHIHMKLFGESYTGVICSSDSSPESLNQMEFLHSLNEVVSYNLDSLFASIFVLTLVLIFTSKYGEVEDV